MAEKYRKWDVVNYLNSIRDACGYLEACLEEAPKDSDFLREVLDDIVRASELGNFDLKSGDSHEELLGALADTGLLSHDSITQIANALKLQPPISA